MKQALIVIDMQNGFLNPESPLCIRGARATVPACAQVIAACRHSAAPVIFVNRAYRADGSDVENTRYQVWAAGGRPLTPGSTGPLSVENPPEFDRQAGDYEIIKPRYSAFFQTPLDLLLRRLGVDTVVLTGTTTPNCIRTTCYDAISLDYRVVVLEDCCSSNTEEIQRANMADMANVGASIRASRDFLADLEGWGLTLRAAGSADVERCAEIEEACFPAAQAASREAMEARRRCAAELATVYHIFPKNGSFPSGFRKNFSPAGLRTSGACHTTPPRRGRSRTPPGSQSRSSRSRPASGQGR